MPHSLVELIFSLISRNNCPARPVVDHLLVRLLWTGRRLELDDLFLRQAQVHALRVLEVERALVQLRHRIICLQQRHLFVHLPNDETRQCHSRHRAHQFHSCPIMHVTVSYLQGEVIEGTEGKS